MSKPSVSEHSKAVTGAPKLKWWDLESNDKNILALEKELKHPDKFQEDKQIRLATAYLGMEMPNKAAGILQSVIKTNRYSTQAYLFEGICYLWMGKDDAALATWKDGMLVGGLYEHFALMSNLVNDPNLRTHIYQQRFSVKNLFDMLELWDKVDGFADNDVIEGFKEICSTGSVVLGITHFSEIISIDYKRFDAYLGRGIGYCLTGQWQNAIDDLKRAISLEASHNDHTQYKQTYSQHAYRFRSIAYAALGMFTLAIADLTKVIVRFPNDYESILLRARYLIKKKFYKQAAKDILSVPSEQLTPKDMGMLVECLYQLGNLDEALEALSKTDEHDPNALFIGFLIFRDVGQYELALKSLLTAAEMQPTPTMQRHLADFLLEVGRPDQAKDIYEQFCNNCPGDVTAFRSWALALYERCDLSDAATIIMPLSEISFKNGLKLCQDYEHPQLKLDGDLVYKGRSVIGKGIMERIMKDKAIIFDTIANINNSINSLSAVGFNDTKPFEIPEVDYKKIELPQFLATKQEINMIIDADRLGMRCIHRGPETVQYNARVIRALGFCVLYFAALIRKKDVTQIFNIFMKIMVMADPLSDMGPNYCNDKSSDMTIAPTYYLVKGQRESSRFENAIPSAVKTLIKDLQETSADKVLPYVDVSEINTYQDIYASIQHDINVSSLWNLKGFSDIMADEETEFTTPMIILQNVGALGFNFSVRSQTDVQSLNKTIRALEKLFRVIYDDEGDSIKALAAIVELIWTRQPLTSYSPELGHVLIHAYAIAKENIEIDEYYFGFAEDFILQMINPDQDRLERLLRSHLKESQRPQIYNEESIEYWTSSEPTVFKIMSLLNLSNELYNK